MEENKIYTVYAAYVDGLLVYIGSGLKDRHKHCFSGNSHVKSLNKDLSEGKTIRTEILLDNLSKGWSISIERDLIKKFNPMYNKMHNAYGTNKPTFSE